MTDNDNIKNTVFPCKRLTPEGALIEEIPREEVSRRYWEKIESPEHKRNVFRESISDNPNPGPVDPDFTYI